MLVFASLHYWIEHAALLGMALSAQGHQVTLGYLPFADWQTPINLFDLKRQNAYARKVLGNGCTFDQPDFLFAPAPELQGFAGAGAGNC